MKKNTERKMTQKDLEKAVKLTRDKIFKVEDMMVFSGYGKEDLNPSG